VHFQVQEAPFLGAATLSVPFTDVIARTERGDRLEVARTPVEGELLRNLEPDTARAEYGLLIQGEELILSDGAQAECLEATVDLVGRRLLASKTRRANLEVRLSVSALILYDVEGRSGSVLEILRAALPKLPFDPSPDLEWCDYLPSHEGQSPVVRVVRDFAAPFLGGPGLEMVYRARESGNELVVTGASAKIRHDGVPIVTTEARLRRGEGVVEASVMTRRRTRCVWAPRLHSEGAPSARSSWGSGVWTTAAQ
jgi:hypothetical protein